MRLTLLIVALLVLSHVARAYGDSNLNPCTASTSYTVGSHITLGIAFLPGLNAGIWTGKNPCNPGDTATLTASNVQVASFRVQVDLLTNLTTSKTVRDSLATAAAAATDKVVSAVVFRGDYVSEPFYVQVDEDYDASAIGVKGKGTLESMSLNVRMENGQLATGSLGVLPSSCEGCGGTGDDRCLNGIGCARTISSCGGNEYLTGDKRYLCQFNMVVGFTGWDAQWKVMTSGGMNRQMGAAKGFFSPDDAYRNFNAAAA